MLLISGIKQTTGLLWFYNLIYSFIYSFIRSFNEHVENPLSILDES